MHHVTNVAITYKHVESTRDTKFNSILAMQHSPICLAKAMDHLHNRGQRLFGIFSVAMATQIFEQC